MRIVELRPAAHRDLVRLEASLLSRSPQAALRMFRLVSSRILSLGEQPFKGHEGPRQGLRELIIKFGRSGYVVRYRVTDDAVIVIRVWHGRENRPR